MNDVNAWLHTNQGCVLWCVALKKVTHLIYKRVLCVGGIIMKSDKNGNISWTEFKNIRTAKDLENYMVNRHKAPSRKYCHYTNLKNINNILDSRELWIGNVSKFNDEIDKKQFGEIDDINRKLCYSLCFSSGVNENLPLWYLYAGVDGKGGRIRITSRVFEDLINKGTYLLYEFNDNNKCREIMELKQGVSMDLSVKDVLYYKNNGTNISLKYNTMTNYSLSPDEFTKYKESNIGFLKGLIWYYEKETRILIKLIGDAANKIELGKEYRIVLNIDDKIYKKLHIDLAPQIKDVDNEIKKYKAINKFMFNTSNIDLSDYAGTIDMDFCKNCIKNKEE